MPNNPRFDSSHLIGNRQIRVFLSSTFSDMEEERNALVKMFRGLKIEANRRNVELTLIDLRWGVTEEEARRGKVLSVCLNEIEHSHPFFIGLLGSRYGYAPEMSEIEKNPELKERYPWVVEDISDGLSITEMEMEYGVLRNTTDIDAAFFIKQSDSLDDNPRLTSLKTKIRNQKQYPVADYSTIEQLCQQAEDELRRILDKHFPETEITPLDRERTAQRAYINSCHTNYLKRQSYFDIIDDFVHSDERNLVLTGDSGVGKSALLANWVKENENNDDFNLFYHFVGNSFSDNNYEDILRHLCDEINELYHFEKRDNNKGIIEEANDLLNVVAVQEKRLIIVIDGINQIATRTNEKLLLWLPAANDKVKFLFSTLKDDETMHVFELRNYRVETVMPLSSKEREHFVVGYLGNYGKRLSESQLRRIVDDPENTNTLVLKSLLDELICFGSYEYLDSRIEYYLSAPSITDFFDRVLTRMEDDYSANGDLVRRTLILIAISERGLSEDELLAILGSRQLDWHLFFCAFYNHFVVKNGLITFSHQYVASAVENRYHITDESKTASFRQEIVSFFSTGHNEDKSVTDRCISELAHQYYKLADWKNLYRILLSLEAFEYYYDTDQSLLGTYWRALLNADKKYSLSAYMKLPIQKDLSETASFYSDIASFVQEYIPDYKLRITLKYFFAALNIRRKKYNKDSSKIAELYNNIGLGYYTKGDFFVALKYLRNALRIYKTRFEENKADVATTLSNIGLVKNRQGNFNIALKYYKKALAIDEMVFGEDSQATATSYNNIGSVYADKDKYLNALEYYQKALDVYEKTLGMKHPDTAVAYNNIGTMYYCMADYPKALEYHQKALEIDKKVLGTSHPNIATDYYNIGMVYYELCDEQSDYNETLNLFQMALEIDQKTYGIEHYETAKDYIGIGLVYEKQGDYSQALEYFQKAQEIDEKVLGTKNPDTAIAYNNIGTAYFELANYSKALEYYNKALGIREKAFGKGHSDTATLYNDIGSVYHEQENYQLALKYYRKALRIDERIHGTKHPDTARDYNNIGLVFGAKGNYAKAFKYHQMALAIRRNRLGANHPDTATSYHNMGTLLLDLEKYPEALKHFKIALRILNNNFNDDHPNIYKVQELIDITKTIIANV